MSKTHASTEGQYEPGLYEIRVKGHLDARWSDWFDGLTITMEDSGDTLLTGPVTRDLGMPLVSIKPLEHGQADQSGIK
jgi:hypothetical protein